MRDSGFRFPSLETLIKLILLTMGITLMIVMMGMRFSRDYDGNMTAAAAEMDDLLRHAACMVFANGDQLADFCAAYSRYWITLDGGENERRDAQARGVSRRVVSKNECSIVMLLNNDGIWGDILKKNRLRLALAFLALVISARVSSLLAYSVTGPLRRLAWGFHLMSDDRSVRLPPCRLAARELVLLTDAFNDMAERLDKWREARDRVVRVDRLASLGEMLSGVAHEIRNPLASMRVHLDLMYNDIEDEKTRERLEAFEQELHLIDHKLNLFLDFARHRSDRREIVDPAELINWVRNMTRASASDQGVAVVVSEAESMPPGEAARHLYGDPDEVRQALLNLVLNGIQAMEEGGGRLALSLSYADDKVVLSVEDTGSGVPEAIRGRIFEPFVTSRSDGTGLGLSIARKCAEDHGGILDYSSSASGSRFFMVLPLCASEEEG
jgi:signal transduction histidine kinase